MPAEKRVGAIMTEARFWVTPPIVTFTPLKTIIGTVTQATNMASTC